MPGLAAFLDQQPPFEYDIFTDGQDAIVEHRPHLVCEPVIEFGAPIGVCDAFDAEPEFGERDGADIELFERMRGDEGRHFGLGLWAAQFREDIRVEQPSRHKSTPRTGMRSRPGSMSMSR
jgi:hypothetical protein